MGPGVYLRGFAKFVAVVLGGLAIGAGLGLGLSALSGDDAPAPATQSAGTAALPEAKVLSATLEQAQSADGRRRNRARVTLKVQLTNGTAEEITPKRPTLTVLEGATPADPNADSFAGALLKPIAPDRTVTGTLRFETAGSITQRLLDERRGTLQIAGRSLLVSLRA